MNVPLPPTLSTARRLTTQIQDPDDLHEHLLKLRHEAARRWHIAEEDHRPAEADRWLRVLEVLTEMLDSLPT